MSYDVVIPLGPNDEDIVPLCIQSVRRYVWDVRRIYVVSHRQIDLSGAIVVDENIFPFTKADIQPYIKKGGVGWYLQQLLKLYSPSVIEGIHENVVLIDADTVFSKRVSFISGKNFLFNTSFHTHKPYFDHMLRLHPTFTRWRGAVSGVVNIMIINRRIIQEIIRLVETHHKEPFWKVFVLTLDPNESSGASEYELYFHYMMRNYPTRAVIRALQYNNAGRRDNMDAGFNHYVNYHAWNQK